MMYGKVIEFYVPERFRQKATPGFWHRGKLIEFCSPVDSVTDERPIQSNISDAHKKMAAYIGTSL
jgi:hypothetical protein